MEQLEDFSDDRLKGGCAFCGARGTSRDHVPSKGLLRKPYPPNLPVIWACSDCNNGFSADEEYFSLFLHCVLQGTTDPDRHGDGRVARGLRRSSALRNRIERSRVNQAQPQTDELQWVPEIDRINRVVLKNALGHVYYEWGFPVGDAPESVWAAPMVSLPQNLWDAFTTDGLGLWPEMGCRMMARMVTGQDMVGNWVVVQDGVYRYSIDESDGGTRVRTILHEYLATEVRWDDQAAMG